MTYVRESMEERGITIDRFEMRDIILFYPNGIKDAHSLIIDIKHQDILRMRIADRKTERGLTYISVKDDRVRAILTDSRDCQRIHQDQGVTISIVKTIAGGHGIIHRAIDR